MCAMQLKAIIKNLAKEKHISAQLAKIINVTESHIEGYTSMEKCP